MRYHEITEAVTSQGFKFGFEFECLGPETVDLEALKLPIDFTIDTDESIIQSDENTGWELISGDLTLNPQNIIKSKETLITLLKNGYSTNSSCGFHIHYSYEGINYQDICWFLFGLSMNSSMLDEFSRMDDIEFLHHRMADRSYFFEMPLAIKNNDSQKIKELFSMEKFRLLRIHPQGTIEWRGPRDFLTSENFSLISKFFIKLYRCSDIMMKLINTSSYQDGDWKITKKEFMDKIQINSHINNAFKKTNISKTPQDMDDLDLAYSKFPWFKTVKYRGTNFSIHDDLIVFTGGEITAGKLENCLLNNVKVSSVYIQNAMANKSHFINSTIKNCKMMDCILEKCKTTNSFINGKMEND